MNPDRRQFVLGTLAAGTLAACGPRKDRALPTTAAAPVPDAAPPPRSILILGGTGFLGPHVVEAALARGHTLTLFNRGKTNPKLFPDLEKLHGDRDGHLEALVGRTWDAVVDTSGYVPRIVKASADLLAPSVGHYVFVSTISVYADEAKVGADETAAVATIEDPTNEDVATNYGALKALCEQAAEAAMPERVTNVRPGLIVGPRDPTGRFTHWPTRLAGGGEVIGPGDGTTPTQWIDGRDLAAWIVTLIERRTTGVYNALGPVERTTMKAALDACNHAGGDRATITWVDDEFLDHEGVSAWQDLPMWIPAKGDMAGFGTLANARAVAAGLTFRPILDTARDTLDWVAHLADDPEVPADKRDRITSSGIARDRELAVLAKWHARR